MARIVAEYVTSQSLDCYDGTAMTPNMATAWGSSEGLSFAQLSGRGFLLALMQQRDPDDAELHQALVETCARLQHTPKAQIAAELHRLQTVDHV